ncbi:MAG: hypothetical protein OXH52_05670 [Gammaproteobacteria bacterium]|nr:hypothetical protein [Gammaproteobacteria bacterium]
MDLLANDLSVRERFRDPMASLFCPWHGKVSRLTLRLHFSWPVEAGRPIYVVYAGPKITSR